MIKDRVLEHIASQGISKNKFYKLTGIPNGTLDKATGVSEMFIEKYISAFPDVNISWLVTGKGEMLAGGNQPGPPAEYDITGYYYPDVLASAGLDTVLENTELNKIPVSIPNFGKDVHFINVFGDSMYPKYCSGEIIGIKQIEYRFLNFGYAYIVIMQDGEVYLKYVKRGEDKDHILLASENPQYEPREFHVSDIRSFFIVKGVISKATM